MKATQVAHKAPVIAVIEGTLTTTSQAVAGFFSKNHRDVLKRIDVLLEDLPKAYRVRNFAQTPYTDPQNGQTYNAYNLTRDGFTLLAMGFTGKTALLWKIKYIEAFNKMEARIAKRRLHAARQKPTPMLPAKIDPITQELRSSIDVRAWVLAQQNYEYHKAAMLRDLMIRGGHTAPKDWKPLEFRLDVLEQLEVAANYMERSGIILRRRGEWLAQMVGEDFDKAVAKFRPPKT